MLLHGDQCQLHACCSRPSKFSKSDCYFLFNHTQEHTSISLTAITFFLLSPKTARWMGAPKTVDLLQPPACAIVAWAGLLARAGGEGGALYSASTRDPELLLDTLHALNSWQTTREQSASHPGLDWTGRFAARPKARWLLKALKTHHGYRAPIRWAPNLPKAVVASAAAQH